MTPLPFEPPLEPMLAKNADAIPDGGGGWLYEPKWDGFRTLVYFDGDEVYLQSRDLKPMGRYFPELVTGLRDALHAPVILDGEVVVMGAGGLDFGLLQMRIHPAESRIRKLSAEIPATFVAFDLLAEGDEDLRDQPFEERHRRLLTATEGAGLPFILTPATDDRALAQDWFTRFEGAGFDGVIAKRLVDRYQPGVRAMLKIKHLRTADCVVAGFRWQTKYEGEAVGSLLLGLYDDAGVLHHVGHTSSFTMAKKRELTALLAPYRTEDDTDGFGGGRTPGAPSRWSSGKDVAWNRLRPELVCEVSFDHLQGDRFRHGTTFQRWRPDKPPEDCTYSQLDVAAPAELRELLDDVRGPS
ncbi:MAG: ATP-dependent DNA ligase [Dehalococcoidia bacterium]